MTTQDRLAVVIMVLGLWITIEAPSAVYISMAKVIGLIWVLIGAVVLLAGRRRP